MRADVEKCSCNIVNYWMILSLNILINIILINIECRKFVCFQFVLSGLVRISGY